MFEPDHLFIIATVGLPLQGVTAIDWFPYTSIHTWRNQSPQGMTFQQHPTILKSVFPPVYSSNRVALDYGLGEGQHVLLLIFLAIICHAHSFSMSSNTVHDHNRDNCIVQDFPKFNPYTQLNLYRFPNSISYSTRAL